MIIERISMKQHYMLIFLCSFLTTVLIGQRESNHPYKYKKEVFIDATAILGNLLSLNSEVAKSPYGFGFRRHYNKRSLRVSGNIFTESRTTFEVVNTNFVTRSINQIDLSLKIGIESGIDVAKNFRMLYGFDLLTGFALVNSRLDDSFSRIQNAYRVGLGPALRIEYRISDRFFLTTESSLYGQVIYNTDEFQLGNGPTQNTDDWDYTAALALPTTLTFSIGF
jgi:hypothetical protein